MRECVRNKTPSNASNDFVTYIFRKFEQFAGKPMPNYIDSNPRAIWIKITFSIWRRIFVYFPCHNLIEIHIIAFHLGGCEFLLRIWCWRAIRCDVMCCDESNGLCSSCHMKWIRCVQTFLSSKLFVQTPVRMTGSCRRQWMKPKPNSNICSRIKSKLVQLFRVNGANGYYF